MIVWPFRLGSKVTVLPDAAPFTQFRRVPAEPSSRLLVTMQVACATPPAVKARRRNTVQSHPFFRKGLALRKLFMADTPGKQVAIRWHWICGARQDRTVNRSLCLVRGRSGFRSKEARDRARIWSVAKRNDTAGRKRNHTPLAGIMSGHCA